MSLAFSAQSSAQGTVETISVPGASLEGNLMGVPTDRTVIVYLPPSYATEPERRYPVVYNLHGWLPNAEEFVLAEDLEAGANGAMSGGAVREMLIVTPDSNLTHEGSMYCNSVTTGNWEDYITGDLIEYIDANYRTMPARESRGLTGHSMGGYGTLRIAMKYPDFYSSIYASSPCCLLPRGVDASVIAAADITTLAEAAVADLLVRVVLAEAAAWSPNPNRPPFYFDLPYENGVEQPAIVAQWAENAPLNMLDQHLASLQGLTAIGVEVGLQDTLAPEIRQFHDALVADGLTPQFEEFQGDHTSELAPRFVSSVLPFFSEHLQFMATMEPKPQPQPEPAPLETSSSDSGCTVAMSSDDPPRLPFLLLLAPLALRGRRRTSRPCA
jgi:S-formylglutathione hydrolase FrmB